MLGSVQNRFLGGLTMASLEPLMTINATLSFKMIGDVGAGTRIDVPFSGTATSSHWEGELPVEGVDYVTMRDSGVGELVIRARMGSGRDTVSYEAIGRNAGGIVEGLTFSTASEKFDFLNSIVAVAVGGADGDQLSLEIFQVTS